MSYLGLTPGENSSSMRVQRTGITKAGVSDLRWALIQGAWSIMRLQGSDPMMKWATALAKRRNRFVAVTALARKLAGVLWAIWTHGTTYQSITLAASTADSEIDIM
jgi:transposase